MVKLMTRIENVLPLSHQKPANRNTNEVHIGKVCSPALNLGLILGRAKVG
jgi:hypothetical protein